MKVVFRVDASLQIGTGHVMRCLTLAHALRVQGVECVFICRDHPGNLLDLLLAEAFHAYRLASPQINSEQVVSSIAHAAWLGVSWEADAKECLPLLMTIRPDWLVLDHYALDTGWERTLRPYTKRIMVIDDLADRQHDCDLLLNQNLGKQEQDYFLLTPENCQLLVGPKYALLRPEFARLREYSLERRKHPTLRHLLVTMGGVDTSNVTALVLLGLSQATLPPDCRIVVVMGPKAPWLSQVRQLAITMPVPTDVLAGISNMAEIMADTDLVIGAAGSTSWERCALGTPSILVCLADNQRKTLLALESLGAALSIDPTELNTVLPEFLISSERDIVMKHMSVAAANVVDGNGTDRVISFMKIACE